MNDIANISRLIFILVILSFCGCAQQRPVFYPNPHLDQVGEKQAQADIDACMHLAKQYGAEENKGGKSPGTPQPVRQWEQSPALP